MADFDLFQTGITVRATCRGAKTFLGLIGARTSELFHYDLGGVTFHPGHYWLYRGHADADWKLTPTAFRDTAEFLGGDGFVAGAGATNREQLQREAQTVYRFFELADRHGLALPEDSQRLREVLFSAIASGDGLDPYLSPGSFSWPPREALSLFGLAQHHRLPTRLLDWTYDPYVAGYFAAEGGARRHTKGEKGNIAVLVLLNFYVLAAQSQKLVPGVRRRVGLVTVPSASNRNLHAQQGLFLYSQGPSLSPLEAPDTASLEDVFEEAEPAIRGLLTTKPVKTIPIFASVELDICHAAEVLRLLAFEGYSAARIFPGFDGVVRAVREMAMWPEHSKGKGPIGGVS